MNHKWRHKRIGDLGRIVTGKTPSSSRPECFGDEYPFVTPTDMHDKRYASVTERFLSQEGADSQKTLLIPAGAVCVSCIGWQMGKAIVTSRPSFTNQQLHSIIPSSDVDPLFLYYSLSTRREEFLSLGSAGGVRTPIINKSAFSDLKVWMTEECLQRKIAGVLSAYDDLIENNTRRIVILEEMAQAIYREWFVNFRFPGHEKTNFINSPLGKIPEGWEVLPVGDVIETFGGGTPSTKESEYWDNGTVTWYSPTDLTKAGAMFIGRSEKRISDVGLRNSSAKLFPPYSVMMTSRATIGVVSISTTEACTNQGFITCVPNARLSTLMIYFWLHEQKETILSVASGATFKEISRGTFRKLPILIPPQPLRQAFDDAVAPITKTIENLLKKQANLRITRDLLLPKLISGQLNLEELDIETGEPLVEATT